MARRGKEKPPTPLRLQFLPDALSPNMAAAVRREAPVMGDRGFAREVGKPTEEGTKP